MALGAPVPVSGVRAHRRSQTPHRYNPGTQVPAVSAAPVASPVGILKLAPDRVEGALGHQRLPGAAHPLAVLDHHLTLADRPARVPRVQQQGAHRRGAPWPAVLGGHLALLQVGRERTQRVTRQEPGEQLGDHLGLGLDHRPVLGVPGQPDARRPAPLLGTLLQRTLLPLRLPLDLAAGHRRLDPGVHPPAVGAQVGLAVGGHDPQPAGLREVDPILRAAAAAG